MRSTTPTTEAVGLAFLTVRIWSPVAYPFLGYVALHTIGMSFHKRQSEHRERNDRVTKIQTQIITTMSLAAALSGCSSNLYEPAQAEKAVRAAVAKSGHETPRLYGINLSKKRVTVQLEDPENPGTLQGWWYNEGKTGGPTKVRLFGEGTIEPGLFSVDNVNFGAVATVVGDMKEHWKVERIKSLELRYNQSLYDGKIRFQWTVTAVDAEGMTTLKKADADGKLELPAHVRLERYAEQKDWKRIATLCYWRTIQKNEALQKQCAALYAVTVAGLKAMSDGESKLRRLCRHADKAGQALVEACGNDS